MTHERWLAAPFLPLHAWWREFVGKLVYMVAMRNLNQRLLAGLGLLCGVGAMAFAIISRPAPPSAIAVSAPTRSVAGSVIGMVPWPEVAVRLREDLRLDAAQGKALEGALAQCEDALARAAENPDALWRDRLAKRAKRDAHAQFVAVLSREQRDDFKAWLSVSAHQNLACWFADDSDCGCGNKKK